MLLICLVAYLLFLVVLTRAWAGPMHSMHDFFLAGQKMPWWAIATTFVAAWFGAGSTMGTMNEAFLHGVQALWLIAIPTFLTCVVVACLFAKRIRQLGLMSPPQAIEQQYGLAGRLFLAVVILASTTAFIASQLVAVGDLLGQVLGWPALFSTVVIMTVIVIYSIMGGFKAVVLTDLLQFVGFTLAIVILFVAALFQAQHASAQHAVHAIPASFLNMLSDWPKQVAMAFTFLLAWSVAPEMWQRMVAAPDASKAQRAVVLAGGLLMLLYGMVIATGILLYQVYGTDFATGQNSVLVKYALTLPPLLSAVVFVGVLSAMTSTIDSSLNIATMMFSHDLLPRLWGRSLSQHASVLLSRFCMAFVALPAIGIALYYRNLIQVLWISADVYASTMFVPMMGVFFAPHSPKQAGVWAMSLGGIPVLLNFLRDFHWLSLPYWWPQWPYTTLLGVGLSLFGFIAACCLQPNQTPSTCVKGA